MIGPRSVAVAVLAGIVALAGCPPKTDPVAERWLERDCFVGERGRIETALHGAGAQAQATLIRAFQQGAPRSLLDEVGAAAGQEWDEAAAALAAGRTYGLGVQDLNAFRAVARLDHVRRVQRQYDAGYRAAALSGLVVIALPSGLALVRQVANDPASPQRASARAALTNAGLPL